MNSAKNAKGSERERNTRRDVRPETDVGEETGCTGQYGSRVRGLGDSF